MSHTAEVLVIRADGKEETHAVAKNDLFNQVHRLIGCDVTCHVNLRDGRSMYLDDLGHQNQRPKNDRATAMYLRLCVPGTTHFIPGDVVIVTDADFEHADDPPAPSRREPSGQSTLPTPWAVRCRAHGLVYLTELEYTRQFSQPDALWICPAPGCGKVSDWDDDTYEKAMEEQEPSRS